VPWEESLCRKPVRKIKAKKNRDAKKGVLRKHYYTLNIRKRREGKNAWGEGRFQQPVSALMKTECRTSMSKINRQATKDCMWRICKIFSHFQTGKEGATLWKGIMRKKSWKEKKNHIGD